jgi:DNA-binding NtrC family response regulator
MKLFYLLYKLVSWLVPNYKDKEDPIKEPTSEELEEHKFKARVAFVDDEDISHVERLRSDGYNIAQFEDIDNIDDFLRKKYHVVILDIQGIGQKISPKTEGWGILKYLKSANPNLVVIMYTGAEWNITKYKDEADIADDFIGKDVEFLDFKSKLDNGIRKAFSPSYHLEIEKKKLVKEISNQQTFDQIQVVINRYGANKKLAMSKIKKITDNSSVLERCDNVLSIINNIVEIYS